MFEPRWRACTECGRTVDRLAKEPHVCSPDVWSEALPEEAWAGIARFDSDVGDYLDSTAGRLESWIAARVVRGRKRPGSLPRD